MRLPFERKRKQDAGQWIYRHRVGLLVTVVLYLLAGILFISYKIVVTGNPAATMYIDLVDPAELPDPDDPEEQDPTEEIDPREYEQGMNRISNENSRLDASLRDDRGTRSQQIYEEAQRVQQQLAAGQEAYRQGMDEVAAINNREREPQRPQGNTDESTQREDVKVQGNVTVSYKLDGRTATYLHIPAYQCKEGGLVVVDITVNRSGTVIAASVNKASSANSGCITERAVQAAQASSFNASPTAPERQRGTITYQFVAQ